MEFPEAATERKVLFARKLLVSKEEHLVTEECLVDLIEGCIIQLCQVNALNLSTDVGRQWFKLDPIELHCSFLIHYATVVPLKNLQHSYTPLNEALQCAPDSRHP